MEVSTVFACECNGGRLFANRNALNKHKLTKIHQAWENVNDLRDERCRRTLLENQNADLKRQISELKDELRGVYRRIISIESEQ